VNLTSARDPDRITADGIREWSDLKDYAIRLYGAPVGTSVVKVEVTPR
jgi:hypothetical protein